MITITFVRHGITDWNIASRIQGATDVPLNETGLQQAAHVGQRLGNGNYDFIYSSDLQRAYQTAEAIASLRNQTIIKDQRLWERGFGRLEGLTYAEVEAQYGKAWRQLEHGIETDQMILDRTMPLIQHIIDEHQGKSILIVSHGDTIGVILKHLLGEGAPIPEALNNTSVNITSVDPEGNWSYSLINCTQHLL